MFDIVQLPVRTDNYVYLLHEPMEKLTAVVDPADAEPVLAALDQRGWRLTHIFNTHHHGDHVGGNLALKEAHGAIVVGARDDAARIPGLDIPVGDGDQVSFGGATAQVMDVPGHTVGHIAYWFEAQEALFCGDTLFSMGCGRMFEGTPKQFWGSLKKLRALPDSTQIYCAHEYTLSNLHFALDVEPENEGLQDKLKQVEAARRAGEPTVPNLLSEEKALNPFLRADDAVLIAALGLPDICAENAVFGALRGRKDRF